MYIQKFELKLERFLILTNKFFIIQCNKLKNICDDLCRNN